MTPEEFHVIRTRLGLNAREMADMLGYSAAPRIFEIERGKFAITPMVQRLMRAYEAGYRPDDWPAHADTLSRRAPQR